MKKLERILFWTPRILSILFILFVSAFALRMFGGKMTATDLIITMLPSIVLTVILLLAWRYEMAGAILFLLAGVFYIIWMNDSAFADYFMISGPAFLISILFLEYHFLFKTGMEKKRK